MALTYDALAPEYAELLSTMEVRPQWEAPITRAAEYIIKHRDRYDAIEGQTGIPWAWIGALHWRESTGNFTKHLHNGDPLTARTRQVPPGRPKTGSPPFTWEESALDALTMPGKEYQKVTDWSEEHICFLTESFNGMGYRLRNTGINSPYLWSGTNHYTIGKFYADRKFSATVRDQQVGAIPVYKRVLELTAGSGSEDGPGAEGFVGTGVGLGFARRIGGKVKRGLEVTNATLASICTYDNAIIALNTVLAIGVASAAVWLIFNYIQKRKRRK